MDEQEQINPIHYQGMYFQCIDAIESALSAEEFEGYLKGNIIKYVWRYQNKNGLVDLKKAQWYLEKLIDLYEPQS